MLAFVEEQRDVSQVGVHCASQEGGHFASLELCSINNVMCICKQTISAKAHNIITSNPHE